MTISEVILTAHLANISNNLNLNQRGVEKTEEKVNFPIKSTDGK